MKRIIFTADDFGLAPEVNAAVAAGYRAGILTAASLMIGAPAAREAVAIARANPGLGVGLHVVVADGPPVLPPAEIPDLVDAAGQLPSDLVRASFRWVLSPRARAQLRREVAAQFEAFAATGLACDHVNAHNHMHLHPLVLAIVLGEAERHGVRHVRLPYEPGHRALALWVSLVRRRLVAAGLRFNDRLAGLAASGHMTEARVLALLETVAPGVTEFYFHPAAGDTPALATAAPGYDRAGELAALTSPAVLAKIRTLGLKQCVFRDLD